MSLENLKHAKHVRVVDMKVTFMIPLDAVEKRDISYMHFYHWLDMEYMTQKSLMDQSCD